jgi:hypothetical protein
MHHPGRSPWTAAPAVFPEAANRTVFPVAPGLEPHVRKHSSSSGNLTRIAISNRKKYISGKTGCPSTNPSVKAHGRRNTKIAYAGLRGQQSQVAMARSFATRRPWALALGGCSSVPRKALALGGCSSVPRRALAWAAARPFPRALAWAAARPFPRALAWAAARPFPAMTRPTPTPS